MPSGKASGSVVRRKSVENAGASPPLRSAFTNTARHGVVASRIVSICGPASGHSYSGRETTPDAAPGSGAPLAVISQRRPSRRSRSATPSRLRRWSGVSK